MQGGAQPVLGDVADHPVVDRHHQFASAALDFDDRRGPGIDRAAPADQPSLMQYCQVTGIPEELTADHTVPSARSDK
ncbi:hypothetical protein FMUBM48_09940 [Nocardia cyriacigeorgica]|nr:hypothetical protein FMUBM48_09940 [Nocardia cyriacigeorgica]